MSQDKEKKILQVAEEMIRKGGYNNFSFRNIANEVGIKSSSVHYHFATKEDLAVAITKDYTDRFLLAMGDPEHLLKEGVNPLSSYIGSYRTALEEDKGMCLCGMLGAEAKILPSTVVNEIKAFFERNLAWLETAYKSIGYKQDAAVKALQTLSLLEGAMIISHAHGDLSVFDEATQTLVAEIEAFLPTRKSKQWTN